MNFYPFHLGDYASATRHLSWTEDAAYRRMLDAYYVREAPLPLERRAIYRLLLATTDEQREAIDAVLIEFFHETPEGWAHARCDAEIDKVKEKKVKASQSAHKRWSTANAERSQSDGNANASPEHANALVEACEGNAPNPNPNPNPKEREEPPASRIPPATRGTRLPKDWEPGPEGMADALKVGLINGRLSAEAEKFRDYWSAQPGQKGVKTDWPATWRNWCRRASEDQRGKPVRGDDLYAGPVV